MKTTNHILIIASCLFFAQNIEAQNVNIINKTDFDFDKVVIFTERTEGRHIIPHDMHYGRPKFNSPQITTDTIAFNSTITLPGDSIYTLKFELTDYVACMCYGVNAKNVKELTLTKDYGTFLFCNGNNRARHADGTIIKEPDFDNDNVIIVSALESDNIDLYFEFVNNTPYTIYAINPQMSDEYSIRYSLFYSNPDYRFLQGESRKISVIDDRAQKSFENKSLTLYFVGVDENSNQVRFKHDVKDLDVDVITLDESNIEVIK